MDHSIQDVLANLWILGKAIFIVATVTGVTFFVLGAGILEVLRKPKVYRGRFGDR